MENKLDEKKLFLNSMRLFSYGVVGSSIVSYFMNDLSILIGLVLGYAICLINFRFHIFVIDALFGTMTKWSMILIILSRVIQMAIYASGLLLAIFMPAWFNLVTVFIGFMFVKMGIYIFSITGK